MPPRSSAKAGKRRIAESGIALIAVLWVMVILAALAASFRTSTRAEVNLARNMAEAAAAQAIADAAVVRAASGLVVPVKEGGLRTDETVYAWQFGGGTARFAISDEGGKIDLNLASRNLLRALFDVVGVGGRDGDALADAIVAYRGGGANNTVDAGDDNDDETDFTGNGGDRAFAVLEELQQVPGMTGEIYRRIAPMLTVYSDQSEPDANAALPAVREARARTQGRGPDEVEANGDEEQWPPLPPGPLSILREGSFATRSMVGVFTIHSEGRSAGGAVFVREAVVAVEYGGDRPYSVRAWRQGRRVFFTRADEAAM